MTNPNPGNTPQATSYRPEPPQLLPTSIADGSAPGVYYRIDGELVPVLHIWLDGSVPVFFEHHVVLWKEPTLAIGIKGKGALKRIARRDEVQELIKLGKMEVRVSEFSSYDVCEGLLTMFRPLAEKKNIDLDCEAPATLPVLRQDQAKVQQSLDALTKQGWSLPVYKDVILGDAAAVEF